ncbi:MAG: M1 family aminopeptidase [Bacteroidota bacterium]
MRYFLVLQLVLLASLPSNSQSCMDHKRGLQISKNQQRSTASPYEITHYDIRMDTLAFASQSIRASAGITILANQGPCGVVSLDLEAFNIDSITAVGYSVTYSHTAPTLIIQLQPAIQANDSVTIWVNYRGTPTLEAAGWGGFHFSGAYAFNMGVGFGTNPHNFGRAWFPCEDNFVSRARYDFRIRTLSGQKAFCNGNLQQETNNLDGTVTWHWKLDQTIPTYLASIAVGPYHTLQRTSNGIPVEWAAAPADTNAVLATFSNLDTCLSSYITAYGDYPFDKVGYCLVPFNSGAMEHATSIHIGRGYVNGSQTYATLWAHELSHMWWGDKVTCATEQDMWLNEGWASFNEALYTEKVSGQNAYRDWIRTNHRKVVQFAHTPAQDGSYLTLNNIPHDYTYGFHVYQKGANIVHTMRNYLGDSTFFAGTRRYLDDFAFSHATSYDLRDAMSAGSGVNMNRFFDDWVFTPGFPHFSIDSIVYMPGGLDHYFIYTRQRSQGNSGHLYEMAMDINFTDGINDSTVRVVLDSTTNVFHVPLYFNASMITLDRYGKVCDARVSNEKTVTNTGTQPVAETSFSMNVQSVGSPNSLVRVEHHFVAPDPFATSNPGIRLSNYRHWRIDGFFNPGFAAKGIFIYDGSVSASTGYLDNTFITGTEDSLVMLYRPGAGYDWVVVNGYTINIASNPNDRRGSITVDTLKKGEYTLGYFDYLVGTYNPMASSKNILLVNPNPSSDAFRFEYDALESEAMLMVFDMGGRLVCEKSWPRDTNHLIWDASQVASGTYQAVIAIKGKRIASTKIVKGG